MRAAAKDARLPFEFGRHETFAIREGWLTKGLARFDHENGFKADLETADALGLGSRMVKSLQYWLDATGLLKASEGKRRKENQPSALAETLKKHDHYFEYPISWWIVHIMLARRDGSVWNWFFNEYQERTFDRTACVDAFAKHVLDKAKNRTTLAVIQREVACLLMSYAKPSANERPDPEDTSACPLRSLSLLVRHSDTNRFERTRPLDRIPLEAFLATVSLMAREMDSSDIPLIDLLRRRNSPGRLLGMDGDMIDEMAARAANRYHQQGVNVTLQGATRTISIPRFEPYEWLRLHFARIG
ncbi:DUF4007 domain-containing protein [Microvirga sp. KLBC 81]|uniref:DUF4007 family protein n=1 Tax=Microvirga sp. KLBC 81 TaxID=1862707 RepID=UPI000D50F1BE|nr:DUF4007 family protein [Microvirga sp. KLBC 81]PVE22835.1 DUF4007 domain-containing protein [Microvirga sp. KLBC 81]